MSFKTLRTLAIQRGPLVVRWTASGVVEVASVEPSGAVRITNIVTRKSYKLPLAYKELQLQVIDGELVRLGDLLPKHLRRTA